MMFLPVPKLLRWLPSLNQTYRCQSKILVTSGCSFTSSTMQLETAASWPGYMIDRCRFDHAVDYSYPGAGNEYIGDAILHHFDTVDDVRNHLVVVMWSGIDRSEIKLYNNSYQPKLGQVSYVRNRVPVDIKISAQKSAEKILEVHQYLTQRQVPFVFSLYSNLLFPPYIPKADTTCEFDAVVDSSMLKRLTQLSWVPRKPLDFLFEYAFINNDLDRGDGFHPSGECNLAWTDSVLLPGIAGQGLITKI